MGWKSSDSPWAAAISLTCGALFIAAACPQTPHPLMQRTMVTTSMLIQRSQPLRLAAPSYFASASTDRLSSLLAASGDHLHHEQTESQLPTKYSKLSVSFAAFSVWPRPVIGALGVMVGTAAGYLLTRLRLDSQDEQQTVLTVSLAAVKQSKASKQSKLANEQKNPRRTEKKDVKERDGGITVLDIRSEHGASASHITGSINIPMFYTKAKFDAERGRKVVEVEINAKWIEEVCQQIPKDAKIVVCSYGDKSSSQALNLLHANGYNAVMSMGGSSNTQQDVGKSQGMSTSQPLMAHGGMGASQSSSNSATAFGAYDFRGHQGPRRLVTPDEAKTLWMDKGYAVMDIRSDVEGRDGRIRSPNKGSVDIPLLQVKSTYDHSVGKKVIEQEVNVEWLSQVKAKFAKDAKIILMCSDGRQRSTQAQELLLNDGYSDVLIMDGGYNNWDKTFDRWLMRRSARAQAAKALWATDPVQWMQWEPIDRGVQLKWRGGTNEEDGSTMANASTAGTQAGSAKGSGRTWNGTSAQTAARARVTVQEASRYWMMDGYSIVDLRSDAERLDGRIHSPNKGSVGIPMFYTRTAYNPTQRKKVLVQEPNLDWLRQMKTRFAKDAKIILLCSDGKQRSMQAQELLMAEGFTNVAVMVGGYNGWDQAFDRWLAPRGKKARAARGDSLEDHMQWMNWAQTIQEQEKSPTPSASAAGFTDIPAEQMTASLAPGTIFVDPLEANRLWTAGGFTILDVRSDLEGSEGRIRGPNKGSVDIPMFQTKMAYNAATAQKVIMCAPNAAWLEQVKTKFATEAKLILMCSDGKKRSVQARKLLESEGYVNILVIEGGYNAWDQTFDRWLALRGARAREVKAAFLNDPVNWADWTTIPAHKELQWQPAKLWAAVAEPAVETVQVEEQQPAVAADSTFKPSMSMADDFVVIIEEPPLNSASTSSYGTMDSDGSRTKQQASTFRKEVTDMPVIDVEAEDVQTGAHLNDLLPEIPNSSQDQAFNFAFAKQLVIEVAEFCQRMGERRPASSVPVPLGERMNDPEIIGWLFPVLLGILLAPLWVKSALTLAIGAGAVMLYGAIACYSMGVEPVLVLDDAGRDRVFLSRFGKKISELQVGQVLVNRGPHVGIFGGAVVFVTHQSAEGTTGLIINKLIPPKVYSQLGGPQEFKDVDTIHRGVGGPMWPDMWSILHLVPDVPDAKEICPGVYMGGDPNLLKPAPAGHVKVVHGATCWNAQQLEGEIQAGLWTVLEVSLEDIFAADASTLWDELSAKQPLPDSKA